MWPPISLPVSPGGDQMSMTSKSPTYYGDISSRGSTIKSPQVGVLHPQRLQHQAYLESVGPRSIPGTAGSPHRQ